MAAPQGYPPIEGDVLKIMSRVTAQAQADEDFRKRYLADPKSVLAEAGLAIPHDLNFKAVEAGDLSPQFQVQEGNTHYLVVPEIDEVVRDESLASAATASCDSTASTAGTVTTCVSSASSKSTNSCS